MWRKGRRRAPVPVFHGSCHRKIHGFVVRKSFPGHAGQAYIVITFIIVTISFHQNAKIPQKQSFSGRLCGSGLKYHICTRSFGKQEKDCHLQRFSWKIRFCIFLIDMASFPVDFCGCETLPLLSCPIRNRQKDLHSV